jgi:putative transposase
MLDWPHSPPHRLNSAGAYMVTAGTYRKQPFFRTAQRLTYLTEQLLSLAARYNWQLEAWAVFPNHYHFVAANLSTDQTLPRFLGHLHTATAKEINSLDQSPGRRVWFQYWDSHLTYPRSYLARLNYVHRNPVHHGLVTRATNYMWCSASWFQRKADISFFRTVAKLRTDRIKLLDDFTVDPADAQ